MKAKELRKKPEKELTSLLNKKRGELLELRGKKEMGHLKETHQLKQTRKDIARIMTVLNSVKNK